MAKFEFVDTVAGSDCAFKAYGRSPEELFVNAALAVTARMVDPDSVAETERLVIGLEADTLTDLFYDWLSEIVYLKDAETVFLKSFEVLFTENKAGLRAVAFGEKINPQKQRIFVDVKAVTMYKFSLEEKAGEWEAFVVLDL